jgi:N-acylglucosamine-6-phosphate 2-epimerase
MHPTLKRLRGGLIVSCQAEGDDPFNAPGHVALFARAAEMGGAAAIRACGPENIAAIRTATSLLILGITKNAYANGSVLITPDAAAVEAVLAAGADVVAADATNRIRPNGMRGDEFIRMIKRGYQAPCLADVSTLSEGIAAFAAGADAVSTTLSGYTPATAGLCSPEPDWELLGTLVALNGGPVIVEGRVWTPAHARRAIDMGAFAVVAGTAITRPRVITRAFVEEMRARR